MKAGLDLKLDLCSVAFISRYQRLVFRHKLYHLREERDMKPETFASLVSALLYEKRWVTFLSHTLNEMDMNNDHIQNSHYWSIYKSERKFSWSVNFFLKLLSMSIVFYCCTVCHKLLRLLELSYQEILNELTHLLQEIVWYD